MSRNATSARGARDQPETGADFPTWTEDVPSGDAQDEPLIVVAGVPRAVLGAGPALAYAHAELSVAGDLGELLPQQDFRAERLAARARDQIDVAEGTEIVLASAWLRSKRV